MRNHPSLKRPAMWVARVCALCVLWFIAYFWYAFSPLALMREDTTALGPDEPNWGLVVLPIDYDATLLWILGPVGWIVGLGTLALALAMAWILHRWPWPLRVIAAAAPPALVLYQVAYVFDLRPELRSLHLLIMSVLLLLAALAGALCRPIVRLLSRIASRPGLGNSGSSCRPEAGNASV